MSKIVSKGQHCQNAWSTLS